MIPLGLNMLGVYLTIALTALLGVGLAGVVTVWSLETT